MGQTLSYIFKLILHPSMMLAPSLSYVAKLQRLSPAVYRILGCNPGSFTLQGTNTYLVGTGKERILIDAGDPGYSEYTDNLLKVLTDENATIKTIICTHWHHDHVGGVPDVLSKVLNNKPLKLHKYEYPKKDETKFAPFGFEKLKNDDKITVEGATIRIIFTPGHTEDHLALFLEEEGVIFSGDCILGEGTAVFEDLYTYMNSLKHLLTFKPNNIYPGHGPVINEPIAKIEEYIAHRNQRESQILTYLKDNDGYHEVFAIVDGVYGLLSVPLRFGAANNVKHHLSKLIKEEKVEVENDKYRFASGARL